MSNPFLSSAAANQFPPLAKPPMPTAPGDLYLIGLLGMQAGLEAARKALNARAAFADADETRLILVQLGLIQSDYVMLDAMITAYLSSSTISLKISQERLERIRATVDQLQGLIADRDNVRRIVLLVTQLLNDATPDSVPAANGAITESDLHAGLEDD